MNILVFNRKGGVGKTTLADEIMFSLERSGINAAFVDLDDQESSIHRDETSKVDAADVVVVDTPGALSSEVRSWMESADVIVIPTNASGRDISMMMSALQAAREFAPDSRRIVAVNRFNRYRAASDFMEALKEVSEGGETVVTLPQAEAFQAAYLAEDSVVDAAPRSKAALKTLEAVNAVRSAAGLGPDPTDPNPIQDYLERQAKHAQARRTAAREGRYTDDQHEG